MNNRTAGTARNFGGKAEGGFGRATGDANTARELDYTWRALGGGEVVERVYDEIARCATPQDCQPWAGWIQPMDNQLFGATKRERTSAHVHGNAE